MSNTILLVEDDPNDAFFFAHCVKKLGIANPVQVAADGREALDYLNGHGKFADREQHPFPCLVILDLKLPYATGFEVLQEIREKPELRRLIVLVLTSSVSDQDIEKAYELGANAYLVKPSDLRHLDEIVHGIKLFWLTRNRHPASQPLASPTGWTEIPVCKGRG